MDRMGGIGIPALLSAHLDSSADVFDRFRIDQLLKVRNTITGQWSWGREQLDRAGLDRRYSRTTIISSPVVGTLSDIAARFQITNNLSGYLDTESDVHAALLLALAAYIDSGADVYARLQIGHNCKVHVDSESNAYARLQISQLLRAYTDTNSDIYARLRIDQNLKSYLDTTADLYAQLRQIDSWTFTFTGTLAAGKTVCFDGRDFTVKNDGVNAIANFTGDFPSIFPGTNWVIYTDSEGSRTIRLVVSKRDRKV
jgi:hypothetical protein